MPDFFDRDVRDDRRRRHGNDDDRPSVERFAFDFRPHFVYSFFRVAVIIHNGATLHHLFGGEEGVKLTVELFFVDQNHGFFSEEITDVVQNAVLFRRVIFFDIGADIVVFFAS